MRPSPGDSVKRRPGSRRESAARVRQLNVCIQDAKQLCPQADEPGGAEAGHALNKGKIAGIVRDLP